MVIIYPLRNNGVFFMLLLLLWILVSGVFVWARPASFEQDFRVTWSESHIKQIDQGRTIQLILDQRSGCGFASKVKYMFGRVSMKIKLVPGDSAGTVTAFYMNSDTDSVRDELDFEFLGNRSGQPYTVQTNIYAHGKGDREQRVNLWFDPAADFHTYSILWNHHHIVFYIDQVPIRVYKNNEAKGIPYPKMQAMGVFTTLWEADNWATRGPSTCGNNPRNWWEGAEYETLNAIEARRYRWVRMNHIIYDYCQDKSRYPITPHECFAGI
ncbi:unnamed protein product [Vicia faba]|uniref:Xyloglucan endotransglucosylase/hydrolase n=1 Tax=Vicia faba TaxID=3906 RepID=A0AAV1AKF6_VICFA|nr:unnamed protein product [Vicia faba]